MRYTDFEVKDFVEDEKFRSWVLNPTPESKFFWEKWLLKNPECEEKILEARDLIESLNLKTDGISKTREKALHDRIMSSVESAGEGKVADFVPDYVQPKKRHHKFLFIGTAACILLVTSLFIFHSQEPDTVDEIQFTSNFVIKENRAGRKSTIFLPDGSRVVLNSSSWLSYDKAGFAHNRRVSLHGEAYFDVAHNETSPFVVYSGSIATTALGTTFNVRAYERTNIAEVVLTSGKVRVEKKGKANSIVLNPGEMVYSIANKDLVSLQTPDSYDIHWKDGIIFYQNMTFSEVIKKLERWYGVEILVENMPQKALKSSGKFDNENLSNVLKSIGHALGFDYEINEDKVLITFKTTPMKD